MSLTQQLVIMARMPAVGAVKSRLASGIGIVPAWSFYRTQLVATVRQLSADPRWRTILAVTPSSAAKSRVWPNGLPVIAQTGGGLGERMNDLFERLPPGPVIIIGSDIPGLTPAHINRAFKCLRDADFVFGPATDGGYWLVGMRRRPRIIRAFGNVRWSSEFALSDTLAGLPDYKCAFTDLMSDVDNADDYRAANRR